MINSKPTSHPGTVTTRIILVGNPQKNLYLPLFRRTACINREALPLWIPHLASCVARATSNPFGLGWGKGGSFSAYLTNLSPVWKIWIRQIGSLLFPKIRVKIKYLKPPASFMSNLQKLGGGFLISLHFHYQIFTKQPHHLHHFLSLRHWDFRMTPQIRWL